MGVEYSSAIVVGVPYNEFQKAYDGSGCSDKEGMVFKQWVHENDYGVQVIHPYYDAELSSCLVGIVVNNSPDYGYSCINHETLEDKVDTAIVALDEILFKIGCLVNIKVYLTTVGY